MDNKRNWNNEPSKLGYRRYYDEDDDEFCCPRCKGDDLRQYDDYVRCADCGQPIIDNLYFINCNELLA